MQLTSFTPSSGISRCCTSAACSPGTVRNEFVLPDKALNEARSFFAAHELALDRPTLFIQPFTSTREKNWPLDRYCAVARHWRERGRQVLFGGGPADRAALEPVRQAGFPVSAGVPLLVSAGLAKLCALTLAGDTGLLHLAAAMGKRVVAIIPSTAPGNKYPFQHPDWAITPSAGVDISTIGTETVIAACERALAESAWRRAVVIVQRRSCVTARFSCGCGIRASLPRRYANATLATPPVSHRGSRVQRRAAALLRLRRHLSVRLAWR